MRCGVECVIIFKRLGYPLFTPSIQCNSYIAVLKINFFIKPLLDFFTTQSCILHRLHGAGNKSG